MDFFNRSKKAKTALHQIESHFFNLPAEIRNQIYHLAFPSSMVHISFWDRLPFRSERNQDSRLGYVPPLTNRDFACEERDFDEDMAAADWEIDHGDYLHAFKALYPSLGFMDRVLAAK
jgi:hypothetical protein